MKLATRNSEGRAGALCLVRRSGDAYCPADCKFDLAASNSRLRAS